MRGDIAFEAAVADTGGTRLTEAAVAARAGDEVAMRQIAAATVWAAFACPAGVGPLYDAIASAWLGRHLGGHAPRRLPQAPVGAALWDEFWTAIEMAEKTTYSLLTATARVAKMGTCTHPEFLELAEQVAVERFPSDTFPADPEADIDTRAWSSCPDGSLGRELADMLAAGTYIPDVGKMRELRVLPPTLARVNERVDRFGAAWRAVAGYDAVESRLIACAGFALAQCGHLFSAGAIALLSSVAYFVVPSSFPILMLLIAEGWRHGRETPNMLAIDWQSHREDPVEAIRKSHGIPVYRSVFSKDLYRVLQGVPAADSA